MTTPIEEAVERLRFALNEARLAWGGVPRDHTAVTVKYDDLRTILNALSIDEERVAIALQKNDDRWKDKPWFMLPDHIKKMFLSDARAAIQSIVGEGLSND
jgi:hypothetical protein